MESFTHIENKVKCVIQEAECCLADIGCEYVENINHGHLKEDDYWKMLQIRNYLNLLNRYLDEADCRCNKTKKVINPSQNRCLNPQINYLPLGIQSVDCFHCLTEREVLKIIEVLKIFCSTCNCNCN